MFTVDISLISKTVHRGEVINLLKRPNAFTQAKISKLSKLKRIYFSLTSSISLSIDISYDFSAGCSSHLFDNLRNCTQLVFPGS